MFRFLIILLLIFSLSGCATVSRKKEKLSTVDLQERLREVEDKLQEKDEEIQMLQEKLENIKREISSTSTTTTEVSKPTAEEIQIALKNAGFYNGKIDGKIGKQTRKAIEEFQKANGLKVDGVVGYKTWEKLKKYLKQ